MRRISRYLVRSWSGRSVVLGLLALLVPFATADASSRRHSRDAFILDYPLLRPFQQNPAAYGGFGGFGSYGLGGSYLPPPAPDSGRLDRVNGLIDEYVAQRRLTREVQSLRLDNEELQERVENLERRLPGQPARHRARAR